MARPARPRQTVPSEVRPALLGWFARAARDLPWRIGPPGVRPVYPVLVSELMLQQTQVSRVLEVYPRFMARFPTIRALAEAEQPEVLGAWTGLGYYRRARHLHGAARAIVGEHGGRLPADPRPIGALPGVGAYTAGAIASLCFDLPVPAVDGNVQRVLQRLFAFDGDPAAPSTLRWARQRAAEIHSAANEPQAASPAGQRLAPRPGSGTLNEALIELGALVCTPRSPRCERCPLSAGCLARARGLTGQIPRPKPGAVRSAIYCASIIVRDGRGRVLIEQRPGSGLWASMHQAPTFERPDRAPTGRELRESLPIASLRRRTDFEFRTTHRDLRFTVYDATKRPGARLAVAGRRWIDPGRLDSLALSSPQKRILALTRPGE